MNISGGECVKLTLVVSALVLITVVQSPGDMVIIYTELGSIVTVVLTIITLHTYGHFPIKFWTINYITILQRTEI